MTIEAEVGTIARAALPVVAERLVADLVARAGVEGLRGHPSITCVTSSWSA